MAHDPGSPDLTPVPAAETTAAYLEPAGLPQGEGTAAVPSADSTAPSGIDGLLARASKGDDILALTAELRGDTARPPVSTGPLEKDSPGYGEDSNPEDAVAALREGRSIPKRLRIASLSNDRQQAIAALADPNRPLEEILRELAAPAATAANAPAAPVPAATILPGLELAPATNLPVAGRDPNPLPLALPTESSEAIRGQIASLRKQRDEAQRNMEGHLVADISGRLDELNDRLPSVIRAERTYEANYYRAFDASKAHATALYPDLASANSPLEREMDRLNAQYERAGSEFVHDPNKVVALASMAAANLGIAPRTRGPASSPLARPAPMTAATPRAATPADLGIQPASGSARTSPPPSVSAQLDQTLGSMKDTNDVVALSRLL